MTRRFDRQESGEKLHMQFLCALAHIKFFQAGVYSWIPGQTSSPVMSAIAQLKE